jgi:hypothetical protein
MKHLLVAVLAVVAVTGLTGLNGCGEYQFQVVQPPGTTRLEESVVVIMNTHTGKNVVMPYEDFIELDLSKYGGVDDLKKALAEKAGK